MSRSKQFVNSVFVNENVTGRDLLENPRFRYLQKSFAYQGYSKFFPISLGNFGSYTILNDIDGVTFVVTQGQTSGFAFENKQISAPPRIGLTPVLTIGLRDSNIKGYRQAFRVRIRKSFAGRSIATQWMIYYALKYGGLVADFDHLEGGQRQWRSFLDSVTQSGLKVFLVDPSTDRWHGVGLDVPNQLVWSADMLTKHDVVVLEKP